MIFQGIHDSRVEKKLKKEFFFWTLDVSQTASFEITLVRLSVRPCGRSSLSFLKIGSLVFLILNMMIADHDI